MARNYVVAPSRSADIDHNVNGENYLARQVIEDHETIDIGILDKDGNKVMAYQKPDPVGFIRWRRG